MLYAHDSLLLIVDMQEKLLPAIADTKELQNRVTRLAKIANMLSVPVWITEHWPDKIGHTYQDVVDEADGVFTKTYFNACQEPGFTEQLSNKRTKILLAGTEAHICVLQTGLGLHQAGYDPVLLLDCIGSRNAADYEAACARWRYYGLEAVTSEMAIYEWLETPAHRAFKQVLEMIR